MRPRDIERLVAVGRPVIARDGSFAVYATSRPSIEANRNVGQLWRVDLDAEGSARRLTRGVADSSPRLSPDDTAIAFLRPDAKGRPQVFVVTASGSEPVQATDAPSGVSSFAWSPDGTRLAYISRVAELGRYGTVEGLDAASEAPRRITGIRWHANALGYLADRPAHVFVIDVPAIGAEPLYEPAPAVRPEGESPVPRRIAAEAAQLTEGPMSHTEVVFTADGTEILTVPDEIETDRRDLRGRVIAVCVDGGAVREVVGTDAGLSIADIEVAPDGTVFLVAHPVGPTGTDFIGPAVSLWIVDAEGPRRLTDPDAIDPGEVGSHLTFLGDDVLLQNRARGRVALLRVTRDGGVDTVLDGDVEVVGHAASADGTIVAAVASTTSFGELIVVDRGTVTDHGAPLAEVGIIVPVEQELPGRNGYPVHGWVAAPEGEGPFPVILQIHGGPYAQYGIHVFDETQVLVDAGYAVVYCNPRGSAGYALAHGRSIRRRMGTDDLADVLDFLDGALAADPRLDAGRVGIMGGSYGGYLTAWTIAHDHRFAGAIVERGFLDPASFQGTSDIGSFFGDEYVGTDPVGIAAQSPMAVAGSVTTPTLVLHSELDFRCPLEQATRYYMALKRQGTEAEMLIFPGENHELTRSGQPRHRVERFAAVLDWWNRHLPIA